MKRSPVTILIAVDDSEPSDWALNVGADLAQRTNGRVTVLHVISPTAISVGTSEGGQTIVEDLIEALRAQGQAVLIAAVGQLPASIQYATAMREGSPAIEIVEYARQCGADYIVMGSRGRGRLSQFVLGSTTQAVARDAPCPVVTVSHVPSLAAVSTGARVVSAMPSAGLASVES